ncbi:YbtB protein [Listeria floridensis FSL S10-1187]|uniref:YbtB protein n=1 Tax=Listeria floridensis FSL S10-1187 TaxID=1265817 RepID=A0ABP3AWZ0_9LIST|nr:PH domain-containing protein [Listeria floridensis]EUJ30757.1 YbtB protein [Listeria floridensis FSL S10-1187]
MYEERKLHPIALVKEIVVNFRKNVIPIIVVLFSIFQGLRQSAMLGMWLLPILVALLILLILAPAVIKYLTYRYKLDEKGLRVKYGLFFRKNIYIPYERIQTVQQKQWFFYVPFHVVQILVETAGTSGKAEADLSAVPTSTAKELKDLRDGKKAEIEKTSEPDLAKSDPFAVPKKDEDAIRTIELKTKELLLMAVTSGGVFGGFIILIGVLSQYQEAIPREWLEEGINQAIRLGIVLFVIAAILLLLILWGISILATLFRFFQFKLKQFDDHLVIEKGLFERNTTTIKFDRIQGVVLIESPFRQMLKLASIKLITAGSSGDREQSGDILLIPIMKKQAAIETLHQILPNYHFERETIQSLPKKNRARFLFIYLVWTVLPFLAATLLFFPYGLIAVILPILGGLKAVASFRATGYSFSEQTLLLRSRPAFSKTTYLIRKERIQSMNVKRSIWMERTKTNHLHVALKSGNSSSTPFLRYLTGSGAKELYDWYRPNHD